MLSILLALLGTTFAAGGTILQKQGLHGRSHAKTKKDSYKFLIIWISGIVLAWFVSAIPLTFASKTLPPHIISAMSGWEMVAIIFLSKLFLKEDIYATDFLYSGFIIAATIVLGLFAMESQLYRIDYDAILLLFIIPFPILALSSLKKLTQKVKASLFAIYAGCMGGLSIVFFNLIIKDFFHVWPHRLSLELLVGYGITAALGVFSEQTAYHKGAMTVVAPLRLSVFIIYPVLSAILLFDSSLHLLQIVSIAVIIGSCAGIFRKR